MKNRHWPAVLLISSFAGVIYLQRLSVATEPLECDTALFSVLAQEWRHGRVMYSDLWDNKPPGIILTYAGAQAITEKRPDSLLWLASLASILTLLGLYGAAFWMTDDPRAGLWAAALWTLTNATPYLEADQPAGEVFVNVFWVWGVALAFRAWRKSSRSWDLWSAGCCLAMASFYKHHMVLPAGIFALSYAAARMNRSKRFGEILRKDVSPLLLPTLLLWVGVFTYFFITHRFPILWDTLVTYSRYYAHDRGPAPGGLLSNLVDSLRPSLLADRYVHGVFYAMAPLAVVALPGAILAWKTRNRRWLFVLGYGVAAWIGMAIPGWFYPHYYQLLLPPLVLAAGAAAGELRKKWDKTEFSWFPVFGMAAIAFVLFLKEIPFYRLSATEWSRLKYGDVYIAIKDMGIEIDKNLLPQETFYELGVEPGLYYYSRRRPPTGILMADHWDSGPLQALFTERIIRNLEERRPELLVVNQIWLKQKDHAQLPLTQWCLKNFSPFPPDPQFRYGPFLLFSRNGGALEARLRSRPSAAATRLKSSSARP